MINQFLPGHGHSVPVHFIENPLPNQGEISRAGAQLMLDSLAKDNRINELQQGIEQAHIDIVTGLPNRAVFWTDLERACKRASHPGGKPISLAIADADRLKKVNDTLGHPKGDDLLRLIADAFRASTRLSDTIYRIGGDEFAIIMTNYDGDETKAQLDAAVEAAVTRKGFNPREVGASIGVAVRRPGEGPQPFLNRADAAMYEEKRRRGNGR